MKSASEPLRSSSVANLIDASGTLHAGHDPIRVLLISDLIMTREGLRHLLESRGIRAAGEVASCAEALQASQREPPDVFLLDMDSRSDAFACLEDLATASPSRIIVLLDRRSMPEDHAELVERGAAGVILKSESPDVLVKAIRKVHAGEAWIDRANTAKVITRLARRRRVENAEAEKIARLTPREHEIVGLIGEGLRNAVIAERLFISEATVRNHLTSILDKLNLGDRFELAVYAFRHGLVHVEGLHQSQHKNS